MRERVGGKNKIGRTAAVLKKPHKATFTFTFKHSMVINAPYTFKLYSQKVSFAQLLDLYTTKNII